MPKVIELFAGVGGFRVGLNHIKEFDNKTGRAVENGDWEFVWVNQWEPSTKVQHAFNCYEIRFGKSPNHVNEDISTINKKNLPDHDLLVGGFPCQDYSVARSLSKEKGIQGKKGVLWWQIRDILEAKSPNFFLLENVDRLLKSPAKQRGRDFAIMLKSLNKLGYIVEWRVINAAEYGMPQKRRRVFIIGYKNTTNKAKEILSSDRPDEKIYSTILNSEFPIEISNLNHISLSKYYDEVEITDFYNSGKFENTGIMINDEVIHATYEVKYSGDYLTLGDVISHGKKFTSDFTPYLIPDNKINLWRNAKGSKSLERTTSEGFTYKYSEGSMAFPDHIDKPGRTMLTSESTLNRSSHVVRYNNDKYRTITEIEAELLNTFPANWTSTEMPKRARYFMMGNALVTEIISRLEHTLRQLIETENKVVK